MSLVSATTDPKCPMRAVSTDVFDVLNYTFNDITVAASRRKGRAGSTPLLRGRRNFFREFTAARCGSNRHTG